MGKIFAIAKITDGKNILGVRIVDVESPVIQFRDVSVPGVIKVLQGGKTKIENLGVINGELVGTNGSINRLASLNAHGELVGKAPLVVINKVGDAGYTVIDYKGVTRKARKSDVVKYANEFGIANGKVVVKDNLEYISSISGEYDTIENNESENKDKSEGKGVKVTTTKDNRTIARNIKMEAEDEVNNLDVFKCMSKEQKQAVQDYYMWYTVDIYESLAKSIRLQTKESKVEALAQLRGEDEWLFNGIVDRGYLGASTCQLGHNLRYEYHAISRDETGEIVDRIIFGETCSGDFFNISKEDMAKLVKARTTMSDEIKIMVDILNNNKEKEEWAALEELMSVLSYLSNKNNTQLIIDIFGKKITGAMMNFMSVKIPFPESLVLLAKNKITDFGVERFWSEVLPHHSDLIKEIYKESRDGLHRILKYYLDYTVYIKIGGKHSYNPSEYDFDSKTRESKNLRIGKNDMESRKFYARYGSKIGGYSRKDAGNRLSLKRRIKIVTNNADFSVKDVDCLLLLVKTYELCHTKIKNISTDLEERFNVDWEDVVTDVCEGDIDLQELAISLTLYSGSRLLFRRSYLNRESNRPTGLSESTSNIDMLALLNKLLTKEFDDKMAKYTLECSKEYKDKMEAQEKERIEAERVRLEAEQEELRLKEEKLKQEEEERIIREDKEETNDKEDKVYRLGELIKKHKDVKDTYYIRIAKDIVKRKLAYDKLSYKQKNIIDQAEADYLRADGQEVADGVVNNTYQLDDRPEIAKEVDEILAVKDNKEIADKLIMISPKIFEIAESIVKRGKVSDRQYKHIKAGVGIINILNI